MDIKFVNHIEIGGQDVLWDSLPNEKKRELSEMLQDNFMTRMGYHRVTPKSIQETA